jgi:hypothetical protein
LVVYRPVLVIDEDGPFRLTANSQTRPLGRENNPWKESVMCIFVTLQDLLDNVARAFCEAGIVRGASAGYWLANQVRNRLDLQSAPSEVVSVDCQRLWLEFIDLQEYLETDPGTQSYRQKARIMLDEVWRGCAAASQR